MTLTETALCYMDSGLRPVPIPKMFAPDDKRMSFPWGEWREKTPSKTLVKTWFDSAWGIAIICGAASGNLTVIDFDAPGSYHLWLDDVNAVSEILASQLVVEATINGGHHVFVRTKEPAGPNQKLAVSENGKTLIETRGEGGLIYCAPTPGYTLIKNVFSIIPTLPAAELDILLALARARSAKQVAEYDQPRPASTAMVEGNRVGDIVNSAFDWPTVLTKAGAKIVGNNGGRLLVCRPGKRRGISATTGNGLRSQDLLYVFSSNWPPLEPGKCYSKFSFLVFTKYDGDFSLAAQKLLPKATPLFKAKLV